MAQAHKDRPSTRDRGRSPSPAPAPPSDPMRKFIIKRFIIIVTLVVAAEFLLVSLENRVFPGLLSSFATSSALEPSAENALRFAINLFRDFLFSGQLGLSSVGATVTLLLLLAMVLLLLAPIVLGALAFARSTEKRVAAEQRARDAERERFYQRRNLMISDMAHDLRTPVMSISGLAQALADGIVDDETARARYLHSISAKSEKMADLVSLLFDFVQLDSEGYTLMRKPLDLPQLMLREAASAYTDVEDAGMELRVEVPETPFSILADEKQMGRVIANLIANAVRHNAPGTVIVLALGRRAGVADIIVADSGKRIDQDVEELFEPFARGDVARSGGGSGLGLSIAKTIVDMHGYQIGLVQPYGTFTKAFIVTCNRED
jgi:signal transduction histidine kinase